MEDWGKNSSVPDVSLSQRKNVIFQFSSPHFDKNSILFSYCTNMETFDENRFHAKLNVAIIDIRRILENHKIACYPEDVSHRFEDKFLLAELISRSTLTALIHCLCGMGLTKEEDITKLLELSKTRNIVFRFRAEEKCSFLRKAVRVTRSNSKDVSDEVPLIVKIYICKKF